MKSIDQIKSGPVLLDVSVFVATMFTDDRTSHVAMSGECMRLLERCKTTQVTAYVAPEAATRLWKMLCAVSLSVAYDGMIKLPERLPQKPKVPLVPIPGDRMRAFCGSPFHVLRITSGTIERAVNLWEKTGAGIEACVSLCSFQEFAKPPYAVVTANDHYDELASNEVFILKPDLTKKPSAYVRRPPSSLDNGSLMISD